jgi:DNA-binding CsgD family transcriptional regulator
MAWIRESFTDGIPGTGPAFLELIRAADQTWQAGDHDLAMNLLAGAALRCFWGRPGESDRKQSSQRRARCTSMITIRAWSSASRGPRRLPRAKAVARLPRLDDSSGIDPVAGRLYGMAAAAVGEHKISQGYCTRSIAGLREQGRLALLAQVLVVRTWNRIHLGRFDAALADAEQAGRLARETTQPFWESQARTAEATVAEVHGDEDKAEALARISDLADWPFARARLQLAYGSWLRLQRRVSESRGPLLAARDGFDDLGVLPWAEQTREELRASGVTSRKPAPTARDQLTTSELQIAQMAAAGLTNQEIGQKLYLSARTVSSHLYRIFPKLGITSRSQLHAALASQKMLSPLPE